MILCRAESVPIVMSVPQKSLSMEPTIPTMWRAEYFWTASASIKPGRIRKLELNQFLQCYSVFQAGYSHSMLSKYDRMRNSWAQGKTSALLYCKICNTNPFRIEPVNILRWENLLPQLSNYSRAQPSLLTVKLGCGDMDYCLCANQTKQIGRFSYRKHTVFGNSQNENEEKNSRNRKANRWCSNGVRVWVDVGWA